MKYGWNIKKELTFGELSRDFYYANLLVDNIMAENLSEVRSLLETKKANPNTVMPELGVAPLHLLAGLENEDFSSTVTLQAILRSGGDPNVRSEEGLTPVHVAAMWGRCKVLDILLANGGDPELIDYKLFLNAEEYAIREQQWKAYGVLSTYSVMEGDGHTMDPQYVMMNSTRSEKYNDFLNSTDVKLKNKILKLKDKATNCSDTLSIKGSQNRCRYATIRKNKKNKGNNFTDDESRGYQSDSSKNTINLLSLNGALGAIKKQYMPQDKKKSNKKSQTKGGLLSDRSDLSKSTIKLLNPNNALCAIKRQYTARKEKKTNQINKTCNETQSDRSDWSKSTVKSLKPNNVLSAIKRQSTTRKETKNNCKKSETYDGTNSEKSDWSKSTIKSPYHNDVLSSIDKQPTAIKIKRHRKYEEALSDRSDRSKSSVKHMKFKKNTNRKPKRKYRFMKNKSNQTTGDLYTDQSDWSKGSIQTLKLDDEALNTIKSQRRKTNIYESIGETKDKIYSTINHSDREQKEKCNKLYLYGDSVSESCDWIRKSVDSIKLDQNALDTIRNQRLSSKIYQTKGIGEDPLKERERIPPLYEESEVCDWIDAGNSQGFDESTLNKINIHRTRTTSYRSEGREGSTLLYPGPKLPKRNRKSHHRKKEDSEMYLCGFTESAIRMNESRQPEYLSSGLSDIHSSDFDERGIPNQRMLCKMSRIFLFMLKKRHIYQKIK